MPRESCRTALADQIEDQFKLFDPCPGLVLATVDQVRDRHQSRLHLTGEVDCDHTPDIDLGSRQRTLVEDGARDGCSGSDDPGLKLEPSLHYGAPRSRLRLTDDVRYGRARVHRLAGAALDVDGDRRTDEHSAAVRRRLRNNLSCPRSVLDDPGVEHQPYCLDRRASCRLVETDDSRYRDQLDLGLTHDVRRHRSACGDEFTSAGLLADNSSGPCADFDDPRIVDELCRLDEILRLIFGVPDEVRDRDWLDRLLDVEHDRVPEDGVRISSRVLFDHRPTLRCLGRRRLRDESELG
nr:hypothetical protein [Kribbella jiaozuonensis]